MLPNGSLGDPLDAPWTGLGSLRVSVGRSGGSWDALWSSSGALWSSLGALWELRGVILELSGTMLEASWEHVRDLFLSLLRVLWKPATSSVLVVFGTFWLTSFAKFAKWQGSFPLENSKLNCNVFFDARACEHQWSLTKTVLGRAPNSQEILLGNG